MECRGFPAVAHYSWSFREQAGKQLCTGLGKQQKEPLVGSGIKGRRGVRSLELVGSDLATTSVYSWLRAKTPSEV